MTQRPLTLLPLLAAGLLAGTAQAQTVLQVSTWLPPNHGATVAQNQWCESHPVEACRAGVHVHPAGEDDDADLVLAVTTGDRHLHIHDVEPRRPGVEVATRECLPSRPR